ncbi:ABC-type transport auxiliary lipoprotein family protein [Ramlibacter sp.]|uniref:ABC-type transport auxiliary lipoprotein family protein n=1 Tax=Ramlibacter sp. TaxID=1917967 RepID=UPI003D10C6FA
MRAVGLLILALALAGCSALPDKPVRPVLYDFGPMDRAGTNVPVSTTLPPLVLADVGASGSFDSSAVLYRLGYSDSHQLRPYSLARWSAQPAQLVRQRLRERLSRDRMVLDDADAALLARSGPNRPRILRVELEEFSHYFQSTAQSSGLLRLRCTLLENSAGGERLLAQRSFAYERAAPSADAPGGVRALTAAIDAAGEEIAAWVAQQR